jgi:hypothetical protein
MQAATIERPGVDFLKRRFAGAIRCGDDRTATRLRVELDRLINGAEAPPPAPRDPAPPPAA